MLAGQAGKLPITFSFGAVTAGTSWHAVRIDLFKHVQPLIDQCGLCDMPRSRRLRGEVGSEAVNLRVAQMGADSPHVFISGRIAAPVASERLQLLGYVSSRLRRQNGKVGGS